MRAVLAMLLFVASPLGAGQMVAARAALSTVSPYATRIGLEVMGSGGNAIDAAVAVSFALAVAHPQAGNIGGGGFLVYYEKATGAVWTLDFREVAPYDATRTMYLDAKGEPIPEASAVGPRAAGVPGSVAGLEEAHRRFGSMPWRSLVEPAAALAREGFRTNEFFTAHLREAEERRRISRFPETAALFFRDGQPIPAGTLLPQPDLAETLERIAAEGSEDFYRGRTARLLLEAMRKDGGIISARDLREYRPTWRAPIRIDWRGFRIYTMAPPSGGGLVLGEMLQMLQPYDLESFGFQTPATIHLMAETARRAYIDRNRHVGDPARTRIPYDLLLSSERADRWRASIDLRRATPTVTLAEQKPVSEGTETTHFSIVDPAGNIASVTTTLNTFFGCGYVVPGAGFVLNNEMDDFTAAPGRPTSYGLVQGDANAIDGGKKMASSMTPTIVFKGDDPFLVLGSPGGGTIPTTVLQVFLGVAVWGRTLGDAVEAPRFHHQAWPDAIQYEKGTNVELLGTLNGMGHATREEPSIGDVHAIQFREDGSLVVAADRRRGGLAGGF